MPLPALPLPAVTRLSTHHVCRSFLRLPVATRSLLVVYGLPLVVTTVAAPCSRLVYTRYRAGCSVYRYRVGGLRLVWFPTRVWLVGLDLHVAVWFTGCGLPVAVTVTLPFGSGSVTVTFTTFTFHAFLPLICHAFATTACVLRLPPLRVTVPVPFPRHRFPERCSVCLPAALLPRLLVRFAFVLRLVIRSGCRRRVYCGLLRLPFTRRTHVAFRLPHTRPFTLPHTHYTHTFTYAFPHILVRLPAVCAAHRYTFTLPTVYTFTVYTCRIPFTRCLPLRFADSPAVATRLGLRYTFACRYTLVRSRFTAWFYLLQLPLVAAHPFTHVWFGCHACQTLRFTAVVYCGCTFAFGSGSTFFPGLPAFLRSGWLDFVYLTCLRYPAGCRFVCCPFFFAFCGLVLPVPGSVLWILHRLDLPLFDLLLIVYLPAVYVAIY